MDDEAVQAEGEEVVTATGYEEDGDKLLVFAEDRAGMKVCFHVVGPQRLALKAAIADVAFGGTPPQIMLAKPRYS